MKVKIKDIAEEISERIDNPKNSSYKIFVGLEHYDSGSPLITRYGSTEKLDSSMKIFKSGDTLIARRNVYLKRAGYAKFDGLTSGDSIVLRAKNDTLKQLLPFIFNTEDFWSYANKFADGSMSKRLSPKILMEYEVNIPENEQEQNELADVLWAINDTIDSYKEMIKQSDELIKAKFLEMFNNELNGETVKLGDLTELITKGTTPTTLGFEFVNKGINFIKIENITETGKFLKDKMLHITEECDKKLKRSRLKENDVLFSIAGAIGRTAIVTKEILPANTNQALAIIRLKENSGLNVDFLNEMLHTELITRQVYHNANGATQINLSLTDISEFRIIVPSLSKQIEFSNFIKKINIVKDLLLQSLQNLDKCYKKILTEHLTKEEN